MNGTAWRIFKKKHRASAWTGAGARRFGGRWNSKGVAVVYCSQNPSLAILEMLVHLQAREILEAYLLAPITFDERWVESVPVEELPSNWRKDPPPPALRAVGDDWIERGPSAILRVPSVIIPTESNYLFNPAHPDFGKCDLGKPKPFIFDQRLGG